MIKQKCIQNFCKDNFELLIIQNLSTIIFNERKNFNIIIFKAHSEEYFEIKCVFCFFNFAK